jgi:4-hydroxy-3-methylbut-2-en-1-yl diphosphate reductase
VVRDSVDGLPERCDVVLVLGGRSRAVENSRVPTYFVDTVESVDLRWLADARPVGIVADASAPPALVDELIATFAGLGQVTRG